MQDFSATRLTKSSSCQSERICFVLSIRNKIRTARKNFPTELTWAENMLDTVDDLILLIAENNIAVFSHELDDQKFTALITHFIQMLNLKTEEYAPWKAESLQ